MRETRAISGKNEFYPAAKVLPGHKAGCINFVFTQKIGKRMKKILFAILNGSTIYIILALLITRSHSYSFQHSIALPAPAILRLLTDSGQMARWWPDSGSQTPTWNWEQGSYQVLQTFLTQINLKGERNGIGSTLMISADATGPSTSVLSCSIQSTPGGSFLWRPIQYLSMMRQKREHARLMDTLSRIFGRVDLVYGFNIEHQKVSDATLLSLKQPFDHDPTPEEIGVMVETVRKKIRSMGGKETNLPMLNVYTAENGGTEAMTAIATDRELSGDAPFSLKRMLPGGNILVAEVKGGPHRIRACQEAVEAYVKDHRIQSPAMPFQRMITDRQREPDTSQWITTINYPIF
jgi:hypothetical protein